MAFASLPLDRAMFSYFIEIPFLSCNSFLHAAAIDFELGFTGASRANATGLARQMGPHSRQAREQILQLRQLYL
jgi:hypothetical protein